MAPIRPHIIMDQKFNGRSYNVVSKGEHLTGGVLVYLLPHFVKILQLSKWTDSSSLLDI